MGSTCTKTSFTSTLPFITCMCSSEVIPGFCRTLGRKMRAKDRCLPCLWMSCPQYLDMAGSVQRGLLPCFLKTGTEYSRKLLRKDSYLFSHLRASFSQGSRSFLLSAEWHQDPHSRQEAGPHCQNVVLCCLSQFLAVKACHMFLLEIPLYFH